MGKATNMIILALVVGLITYNLWPFMWKAIFYQGVAFERFLLAKAILLFVDQKKNFKTPLVKVARMAVGLAVLDFIDECFFKPWDYEVSEYRVAALIVAYYWIGPESIKHYLITVSLYFPLNLFILLNRYKWQTIKAQTATHYQQLAIS
jgi:hypothetical protein